VGAALPPCLVVAGFSAEEVIEIYPTSPAKRWKGKMRQIAGRRERNFPTSAPASRI